jgi:hypothetical protein
MIIWQSQMKKGGINSYLKREMDCYALQLMLLTLLVPPPNISLISLHMIKTRMPQTCDRHVSMINAKFCYDTS